MRIKTVKVGTFNLQNLMLPNVNVYGNLHYTPAEFERKAAWTDFMLTQMDADIIGFQECFHKDALTCITKQNDRYRKAELFIADEVGDQPRVALLSRYPVENITVYDTFPQDAVIDVSVKDNPAPIMLPFTKFTRPVLHAEIRIPEFGLLNFFVIHLKSKRPIFHEGEDDRNPVDLARAQARALMLRAAESTAVRSILMKSLQHCNKPVVVVGDVNDTGESVTSRIISGEVPQHKLPDKAKKDIWDVLLYHVKDIQARRSYQDFYYTHIHNGMYESLDHIMVSQELVIDNPRNVGRVGLVSVFNDHLIDQTFTNERVDKCKSDHGVVVCSLELDVSKATKLYK